MRIINHIEDIVVEGESAIAIGKFDGVHLGHQMLIRQIVAMKKQNRKAVVFTFEPPAHVYFAKKGSLIQDITTKEEKRRIFENMGIDYLIEFPFNESTSQITASDFVKDILVKRLHMKYIVAGEDISFGYKGIGNVDLLKKLGETYQFQINIIEKLEYRGSVISSSLVRDKLKSGAMQDVSQLLGRNYVIYGKVVAGKQIGRTIDMPTANVIPHIDKCMPLNGVYYSVVKWKGRHYNAITNIGCRPTVSNNQQISVETYLLDVNDNMYEQMIEITLLYYKRIEKKFDSLLELKEQVMIDKEDAKKYFLQK